MKKNPLVIDLRQQLPLHKRYVSNTTTLLLWGSWLLLWRPIVIVIGLIYAHQINLLNRVLETFSSVIENGFTALVACAITLWMWSTFVSPKSKSQAEQKKVEEYAKYFGLHQKHLEETRQQKVVYVHHNREGKITHLN
ncbi:poly-beta-1,6-N-acetyl-D-glucosamine biosynthesis protein PgaD [Acinetobacter rudis]|uniref:Poly-beta-1,6-N-acetyl-D-glucosamine biosynthesis protein PgaD n=1 Tax=Acinetobacter rudis CIP 110305 TaxID=421052 RepID=S3N954_9GAMM|nr:poly-beta-1,6-N-acetyl-D-glucosamine biosynthesis protein PgaD [Acinetobacter rudis]EPF70849.1 poly-beta-1,6-N-acetyl-D-glucosamine biosynthesis protein PgaD [Acinetobacter rudis CIP 110305]